MAGTLVKSVMLKIVADDGDTELKLDKISEKADELAGKHPELKVRIDTAAAQAKLAVLREELKSVGRAAEEEGGTRGLLGRLFLGSSGTAGGLIGGALSGLGGLGSILPGIESGAASTGGEGGPGLAGGVAAVGGAAIIAGLLSGLQGIVPMLASATLGVGAFGAVAYPQFRKISGAMQQLQSDTQAYDRAQTKASRSSALKHIQQDWAGMSGPQRDAVHGIQSLESGFSRIASSLSPLVFRVFAEGLKDANKLLPFLGPLAQAGGKAVDGLLQSFGKFESSAGFKSFMANMTKLSGPSIKTLGEGIGQIVVALGKLIVSFENPAMQRTVGFVLRQIADDITFVADAFAYMTPRVVRFFANVAQWTRDGKKDAEAFGHGVVRVFRDIEGWLREGGQEWDRLVGVIGRFGRRVSGDLGTARRDVRLLFDAITRGGEPLHRVEADFRHWGATVRHAAMDVIHDMEHAGKEAEHWLGHVITRAVDDVTRWFSTIPGKTGHAMGGMLSSVTSWGGRVLGWFEALPGKIGHWLSRLPGQMFSIGKSIISGLVSGIESAAGALVSSVGHIAGIVTSGLAGLLGIHSPSRVTRYHGQMLARGLALGMDDGRGQVQSAAARMAGAAGLAGAAGGGGLVVEIHAPKSGTAMLPPAFWTELASGIRVRGGSPEILNHKVVLR